MPAALDRLGDVLGQGRIQLRRLGAIGDGPHRSCADQVLGVLVVDVGQQEARRLILLLAQDLQDFVEALGADELEVDVVGLGELGELVLQHPADTRRAGAQQDLRRLPAAEVRPRGGDVDEQKADVDGDAEDHQRVDQRLLQHAGLLSRNLDDDDLPEQGIDLVDHPVAGHVDLQL